MSVSGRNLFDEFLFGTDNWPTWLRSRLREARLVEDQQRYGDLLADVIFLRQRDFTVFLDGHDKDGNPTLICDGKPITADEVRAKAARERRLLGHE